MNRLFSSTAARLVVIATFVVSCSVSIVVSSSVMGAGKSAYDESLVRAAVVFGILRFTSWPENFAPDNEVSLCSFGPSASASAIASLNKKPSIGKMSIRYKEVQAHSELAQCHAVIVGEEVSISAALPTPTLIICDGCDSVTKELSAIKLARIENRIQFEVDLDRVDEQELSLSSALIELAVRCSSTNPAIKGCRDG